MSVGRAVGDEPLTAGGDRLGPEEYIELLQRRQDQWLIDHPRPSDAPSWLSPLLEWFVQPGDEDLVDLNAANDSSRDCVPSSRPPVTAEVIADPPDPLGGLTITHSHREGTLLTGTHRGDGTSTILRADGWRWGRTLDCWYLPRSRDNNAGRAKITETAHALRAAGYAVTIDIDDQARPTADVEADRATRAEQRAQVLRTKAGRRRAAADAAWSRHQDAVNRLPPQGEPVKVDHHSAPRHLRAIARVDSTGQRAAEAERSAAHASERAATAAASARPDGVETVANRLRRLEAEIRRLERRPHQDDADLARARDQLVHWTRVRQEQLDTGIARAFDSHSVTAGDLVQIRGRWYLVHRANTKSVTVQTQHGTDRAPWTNISDHRPQ